MTGMTDELCLMAADSLEEKGEPAVLNRIEALYLATLFRLAAREIAAHGRPDLEEQQP